MTTLNSDQKYSTIDKSESLSLSSIIAFSESTTDTIGAVGAVRKGNSVTPNPIIPYAGIVPRSSENPLSKVITRARYVLQWLVDLFANRGALLDGSSDDGQMYGALYEMGLDLDDLKTRSLLAPVLRNMRDALTRLSLQSENSLIPTNQMIHLPGALLAVSLGHSVIRSPYMFEAADIANIAIRIGLRNVAIPNGPSPFWCMHLNVDGPILRSIGQTQEITSFVCSFLDAFQRTITIDATQTLAQLSRIGYPGVYIKHESFPGLVTSTQPTSLVIIPIPFQTLVDALGITSGTRVRYSFTLSGGGSVSTAPLTLYPMQSGLGLTGIPMTEGIQSRSNQDIYALLRSSALNVKAPVFLQISYTLFWLFTFVKVAYEGKHEWDTKVKVKIPRPQAFSQTYAYAPSRYDLEAAIRSVGALDATFGLRAMVNDLITMMSFLPGRPVLTIPEISNISSVANVYTTYKMFSSVSGIAEYKTRQSKFQMLSGSNYPPTSTSKKKTTPKGKKKLAAPPVVALPPAALPPSSNVPPLEYEEKNQMP